MGKVTLADLRELCEQATPGPWIKWCGVRQGRYNDDTYLGTVTEKMVAAIREPKDTASDLEWDENDANADFIVAARTWLPALIEVAIQAADHRTDACNVPHADLDAALARLDETGRP